MSHREQDRGSWLDAHRRERELDDLVGGEVADVLVVGGGITGAGVALDAASRGLSVALIERGDLAAGTSRWSSKLVHGGLRYLVTGQVAVAQESIRERAILATTVAPHLVRPLAFVTPLGGAGLSRGVGVAAAGAQRGADALSRRAGTPPGLFAAAGRISAEEVGGLVPALDPTGLRGGLVNWDGQLEDDARLVIAVARTAAAHGARILTRCLATDVGAGGATVRDQISGTTFDLRARRVVNATGVWAASLDPEVRLSPSRGTHLVLPASALDHPRTAIALPVPGHLGRVLFALPKPDGLVILGITDEPTDQIVDTPEPTDAEIDFLLDTFSAGLRRPLTRADLLGTYAGLRPLLTAATPTRPTGHRDGQRSAPDTADLSRRHAVLDHGAVVTVTGGKLTTYRRMAADVVDLLSDRRCRTAQLPLVGAPGLRGPAAGALPERLVRRFGAEAPIVAGLAAGDPRMLEPVEAGVPALRVEVLWAQRAEGALTAADVLDGRLRLDLVPARRAAASDGVDELVGLVGV